MLQKGLTSLTLCDILYSRIVRIIKLEVKNENEGIYCHLRYRKRSYYL